MRAVRVPRSRLLALVRVLLLLGVGLSLSAFALLSAGRARAAEMLLELGAQVMRLSDGRYANDVQRLSLNGSSLFVQSGSSERAPEQVVEQFYAACKQSAALEVQGTLALDTARPPQNPWLERWLDGVVVQSSGAGTAIACIDAEGRSQTPEHLSERMQRFFASGDLAELGRLRYAWVQPSAGGSAFLTLWTAGSVALLDRFPAEGDAPGFDLPGIERVQGSRRLLSASLADSALGIYEHRDGNAERLLVQYRAALERAGYQPLPAAAPVGTVSAQIFVRADRELLLGVQSGDAEATFVTLLTRP